MTFLGRLNALAEAHALIFQANWGDTDLRRVLERTLAPFARDGQALAMEGPPVLLPPKPALALSLILHELATNAVKYGSLSREAGTVGLRWRIEGSAPRQLVIEWLETGGPPAQAPLQRGFDGELIERSARYELDGEVAFDFGQKGLSATIRFPADWEAGGAFDLSVPAEHGQALH